jgi:hypothetical protein
VVEEDKPRIMLDMPPLLMTIVSGWDDVEVLGRNGGIDLRITAWGQEFPRKTRCS